MGEKLSYFKIIQNLVEEQSGLSLQLLILWLQGTISIV